MYPEHYSLTLPIQLEMFKQTYKAESLHEAKVTYRSMEHAVRLLFPQVLILLKLLLVCPVSSCECERSFSALRRLKTWLRTTMVSTSLMIWSQELRKSYKPGFSMHDDIRKHDIYFYTFSFRRLQPIELWIWINMRGCEWRNKMWMWFRMFWYKCALEKEQCAEQRMITVIKDGPCGESWLNNPWD
jgi:hypothetical protein